MTKVWAASVVAQKEPFRRRDGRMQADTSHTVILLNARNRAHAKEQAESAARRLYPSDEGYTTYSTSLICVNDELV